MLWFCHFDFQPSWESVFSDRKNSRPEIRQSERQFSRIKLWLTAVYLKNKQLSRLSFWRKESRKRRNFGIFFKAPRCFCRVIVVLFYNWQGVFRASSHLYALKFGIIFCINAAYILYLYRYRMHIHTKTSPERDSDLKVPFRKNGRNQANSNRKRCFTFVLLYLFLHLHQGCTSRKWRHTKDCTSKNLIQPIAESWFFRTPEWHR